LRTLSSTHISALLDCLREYSPELKTHFGREDILRLAFEEQEVSVCYGDTPLFLIPTPDLEGICYRVSSAMMDYIDHLAPFSVRPVQPCSCIEVGDKAFAKLDTTEMFRVFPVEF
jgi:hypothetical protein